MAAESATFRPPTIPVVTPARTERPADSLRLELGSRDPDRTVPDLIEYAAELHVSDLFLYSNEDNVEVAVRHLGLVRTVGKLPAELGRRCISYIKTLAGMNISERRRPLDGRWLYSRKSEQRLDLRINTIPTLHGEDLTIRILDQKYRLLSLNQLGLDPHHQDSLQRMLSNPSGLMLVTGPTESGKSTTLYGCLSHLNSGERKINTIEDPIEYSLAGVRQSQVSTSLGLGFDVLLRNVLRQAPDVIMIGEIRDPETALTAVRAAGSGHMVLSTLHAPVAAAAVNSLLRLGVHPHLLSSSLLGVVSQRLLRTLCPNCKVGYDLPLPHLFDAVRPYLRPGDGDRMYGPQGCDMCFGTGYAGRTGVFEMLRVTPDIRALVDATAPVQAIRKRAVEDGMVEFRQAAVIKLAQGQTALEEVVRVLPAEYLVP